MGRIGSKPGSTSFFGTAGAENQPGKRSARLTPVWEHSQIRTPKESTLAAGFASGASGKVSKTAQTHLRAMWSPFPYKRIVFFSRNKMRGNEPQATLQAG
jgi:hypothetical protein